MRLFTLGFFALAAGCGARSLHSSTDAEPGAADRGVGGTDARRVIADQRAPAPDLALPCAPTSAPRMIVVAEAIGPGQVRASVASDGCKDVFRLVGCCGEGLPVVETEQPDGSWRGTDCAPALPPACCDAMPHCQKLTTTNAALLTVTVPDCRGKKVRLAFNFAASCANPEWQTLTDQIARSNPVVVP